MTGPPALTPQAGRRLDELVRAYELPETAVPALVAVLDAVATDPTAATTVTEPERAVDVHVADSLTGLKITGLREAGRIADLGACAGFPGLALAAALPGARVDLVESLSRKCAFLERAVDAAGLANAEIACVRAEEWAAGIESCHAVTARAVAALDVLVEYAAPLLTEGGTLVAWKGIRDEAEEAAGDRAAGLVGLERTEVRPVRPHRGADHRHLYVYSKVRPTPDRYPRRAGMARKRPLGGSSRG